jgi:hypothetical protein
MIVAFRSAKVAESATFAERKATLISRAVLNETDIAIGRIGRDEPAVAVRAIPATVVLFSVHSE